MTARVGEEAELRRAFEDAAGEDGLLGLDGFRVSLMAFVFVRHALFVCGFVKEERCYFGPGCFLFYVSYIGNVIMSGI